MAPSVVDKNASCLKRFARIMLSHVGLFVIVTIYTVAGAYLFIYIESDLEKVNNLNKLTISLGIRDSKSYIINDMWHQNHQNLTAAEFKTIALNNLKMFHDFVTDGVQNHNYDGHLDTEVYDWTVTSSLLFTFTTVAAIGYGHISPKTSNGKLFCIFYGLVGVPLLLVFLANIGDFLARAFRYTYSRGVCVWCRMTRKKSEVKKGQQPQSVFKEEVGKEPYMPTDEVQVPITVNICVLSVYLMLGGILFQMIEDWKFHEAAYFSFITLSTIGFGDYYPGKSFDLSKGSAFMAALKMGAAIGFSLFGMALLSMCINLIQEQIVSKMKWLANQLGMEDKDADEQVKHKYRMVNKDGFVTQTDPDRDGNNGMVKKCDGEKLKTKFKRRQTMDNFDGI